MESSMKTHMIKSILLALLLMAMLSLSGCKSTADVEAEFDLGYDGVIKISDGNPITAKINNQGEGFEGEIQVEIEKDGASKMIFAKAFEIAASSEKEIEMYVPIYMIQKSFVVRIVEGNTTLYEDQLVAKKIISPEHTIIAVITDQADDYRFINNIYLPKNQIDDRFMNSYQNGLNSYQNTSAINTKMIEEFRETSVQTHIMYFESFAQFREKANYDFMDYIYIGKSSHLNLDEDAQSYLKDWMNHGNTLFIETGVDYKKIMSQLPQSFINYDINGVENIYYDYISDIYLDDNLNVTTGVINEEVGGDYVLLGDEPLGIVTNIGAGNLVTLMIDMSQSPLNEWEHTHLLLSDIFGVISEDSDKAIYEDNYYNNNTYRLRTIPAEKAPPYSLMVLIFMAYIAIVGPILYAVFKHRDKRDHLWIAIPVTSMACILVLYVVGFATRFDKPISNSISTITYREGDDYLEVDTDIALFNNRNSDVEISWSEDENIAFSQDDHGYYGDYRESKELVGKMVTGKRRSYTVYDSPLWTPSYMKADKVLPFDSEYTGDMINIDMVGGEMEIEVTNPTILDLDYAFAVVGKRLYAIGELGSYETVKVSEGYTGELYQFFDQKLAPNIYNDYTPEGRKIRGDIDMMRNQIEDVFYRNSQMMTNSATEVAIYGLNKSSIGYEIMINGEETEDFSRNIVKMTGNLTYVSGQELTLDYGSIKLDYAYDEFSNGHVHIYTDNHIGEVIDMYQIEEVDFKWKLPEFMTVEGVELSLGGVYRGEEFYHIYNNSNGLANGIVLSDRWIQSSYALYNSETDYWDLIELDENNLKTLLEVDLSKYVVDGEIEVKLLITEALLNNGENINTITPDIKVKGVVK